MIHASENKKFNILLVEDNDADVYLFRRALQRAGLTFEITVIENGSDALHLARTLSDDSAIPDIFVLDLNLPTNNGIEILTALRANERLSHIPVAVVTSSDSPAERKRVESHNGTKFIVKQTDLEAVLAIGTIIKSILLNQPEPACPVGDSL